VLKSWGNVYEQFLGKVIRLTAGHQAKVETKPEVKKAGGVYYTPQYIVDYIVKNTVGKLVEGKTPEEIAEIKVLDPACGSGSFLIGAYTYLLRYHLDWYLNNEPKKHNEAVFQVRENEWYLTTVEKKRILLNNIFGVDIDPQAVEVTKLSLLLKVLEHESRESIDQQVKLGLEGVLPNLEGKIKCGNSLIGPDFYDTQQQATLFDEAEMRRVNVFDWDDDVKGFGEIMKRGGFDYVIGNPPYRMLQPHNTTSDILDYLKQHFFAADFKIDFFHLFLQKGVSSLVEENGFLGFIVPVTLVNKVYIKSLRYWLTEKCCIDSISVAEGKVFTADVHTCVVVLRTEPDVQKRGNNEILTTVKFNKSFVYQNNQSFYRTKQTDFFRLAGYVWNVLINNENSQLIFRMIENNEPLGKIGKINRGLITGNRKKYFSKVKQSESHVPIIAGADVFRYRSNQPSEFVLFDRPPSAGGCWDKEVHNAPHKIVVRQIGHKPTASLIQQPLAVTGNIFTIRFDNLNQEKFVLGIINSKLIEFFWKIMFTDFKTSFPQVAIFSLSQIPIHTIDFSNPTEKAQHDKLVALVDDMLELQKKYHDARMERDKELYERQIKVVDVQIDRLVYDLYGLTGEEVGIVEKSL
jgi:type I restriction-modification system DNA methylase subunit